MVVSRGLMNRKEAGDVLFLRRRKYAIDFYD
jgi:hypothetical protein